MLLLGATMVITQSSLGATLAVSWQRFIGTAVGAALGALVASHFETYTLVFAASVFLLGRWGAGLHSAPESGILVSFRRAALEEIAREWPEAQHLSQRKGRELQNGLCADSDG